MSEIESTYGNDQEWNQLRHTDYSSASLSVCEDDYPFVFGQADRTSLRGQLSYKRLLILDLILVVTAGALGAVSSAVTRPYSVWLSVASVVLLVGTLAVEGYSRRRRPERRWYGGRFVAETLKSAAWRYMMHADPYDAGDEQAVSLFEKLAQEAVAAVPGNSQSLEPVMAERLSVTPMMRRVRVLSLADRKRLYLEQRVRDQAEWYTSKARSNARSATVWFRLNFGARFLALVFAFVYVVHPTPLQLTQVFVGVAAAVTAWVQLGRHEELSQSYSIAADELTRIEGLLVPADEHKFGEGVIQAEDAISREHKMWVAKRL